MKEGSFFQTNQQAASKRPNVIWVFGDQHRAQTLGCSGDINVHTPNLDNIGGGNVDKPWLMFDLNEDPYELANLAHVPGYQDRRKQEPNIEEVRT